MSACRYAAAAVAAAITAVALLGGAPAVAQPAELAEPPRAYPFTDYRDGQRWRVAVERGYVETRQGRPERRWSGRGVYEVRLARTLDAGNVLTWRWLEGRADPQPPLNAAVLASGASPEARTDGSLLPVEVRNWEAVRTAVTATGATLPPTLTARAAATFLLTDAALLSLPVDLPVEPGETLELADAVPSPLGGAPIPATARFTPEPAQDGVVPLRWSRDLPPDALAGVVAALQAQLDKLPEAERGPARQQAAGLTLGRQDRCRFTLGAEDGVTRTADCETVLTLGAAEGAGRRVETVSIVQAPLPDAPAAQE